MTPDLLQIGLDRALIAYFGTAFNVDPTSAEYKAFVAGWNAGGFANALPQMETQAHYCGMSARAAYERVVANAAAALESESTASGE